MLSLLAGLQDRAFKNIFAAFKTINFFSKIAITERKHDQSTIKSQFDTCNPVLLPDTSAVSLLAVLKFTLNIYRYTQQKGYKKKHTLKKSTPCLKELTL